MNFTEEAESQGKKKGFSNRKGERKGSFTKYRNSSTPPWSVPVELIHIGDWSCYQLKILIGILLDYGNFGSLYKCRETRRSPTYEAYPRSRRCILYLIFTLTLPWKKLHRSLSFYYLRVCRSRSRSHSPSYSRRYSRGRHSEDVHRSKPVAPKIEYITEFGGSGNGNDLKLEGLSPPTSPSQADVLNRSEHSTFNSCKDRLDIFSLLQLYHIFVTWGKLFWFRTDYA